MDAPKCRICSKNHYGACDPKDLPDVGPPEKDDNNGPAPDQSKPSPKPKSESTQKPVEKRSTDKMGKGTAYDPNAAQRARQWREANRDRWNEYMREYRRRRKG